MNRHSTRALLLALVALAAMLLAACGGSGSGSGGGSGQAVRTVNAAEAVEMLDRRIVIDVRTPAEFAAGHVAGAQNIDVEAGDFATRIASLDKGGAYLLYCRTGRRSALAAAEMAKAGFTNVVDAGGFEGLVAAGAPAE